MMVYEVQSGLCNQASSRSKLLQYLSFPFHYYMYIQ